MLPPPAGAAAAPAAQRTDHQMHQQGDRTPPYILIGSDHSLYTGKLRAYLIWRGVPFIELTASAELYKRVILPRTGGHPRADNQNAPPPLRDPGHAAPPPPSPAPATTTHQQRQLPRSNMKSPPNSLDELYKQVILPQTGGHTSANEYDAPPPHALSPAHHHPPQPPSSC